MRRGARVPSPRPRRVGAASRPRPRRRRDLSTPPTECPRRGGRAAAPRTIQSSRRRRDSFSTECPRRGRGRGVATPRTIQLAAAAASRSPRNVHVVGAAAGPRLRGLSSSRPRRRRVLHGMSTSRPRRRRGLSSYKIRRGPRAQAELDHDVLDVRVALPRDVVRGVLDPGHEVDPGLRGAAGVAERTAERERAIGLEEFSTLFYPSRRAPRRGRASHPQPV